MPTQKPAQQQKMDNSNVPQRQGRGGARKGAGRKPRHGVAVVTGSISLPPEAWALLDAQRGERSRSEEVLRKIQCDALR